MKKLRPLIKGQSLRIDNHQDGKPIVWDWPEGGKPDDVHLDKEMNEKVNKKKVKTRVTLNNDQGANGPKKYERKDQEWKSAYDKMMKEVQQTLKNNKEVREQLIEDVNSAIREIGPNKAKRAVRKALKRIADHFDLSDDLFLQYNDFNRGTAAFYFDKKLSQQYYVGFGLDYAFYLGEGDGQVFSRRVRGWHKKR
jgi:hypothetical protein